MDQPYNPYQAPKSYDTPVTSEILTPYLNGAVYPLQLSFKIFALAPQIYLRDANGRCLLYIRQKLFKFKEHIEIYTDETRSNKIGEIRADRIIDWSAKYNFTDAMGGLIGQVRRKGLRSLWKAHYEVMNPGDDTVDYVIREENAFAKIMDGFFSQIPLVGFFAGYVFNPRFAITEANTGHLVMRTIKQPALWEGRFSIEKSGQATPRQELNMLLSVLMMLLLERRRG